jgi:hypothetical protein
MRLRLQDCSLPFSFDGASFRAHDEPFSVGFTAALVAVLSLLPLDELAKHILTKSYLSTRRFAISDAGARSKGAEREERLGTGERTLTYADVFSAIVHHRLAQEFSMGSTRAPVAHALVQTMLQLNPHKKPEAPEATLAGSVMLRAFLQLRKETFWTAFPWCCTAASAKRDALQQALDGYIAPATGVDDEQRERLLERAHFGLDNEDYPVLNLAALAPALSWPLHERKLGTHPDAKGNDVGVDSSFSGSVPDAMARANAQAELEWQRHAPSGKVLQQYVQQRHAEDQLRAWKDVEHKQRLWSARAAQALQQAQMAEAAAHRAQAEAEARSFAFAAYHFQHGLQESEQAAPPPQEGFRQLPPSAPRLEYDVIPAHLSKPEYAPSPPPDGEDGAEVLSPFLYPSQPLSPEAAAAAAAAEAEAEGQAPPGGLGVAAGSGIPPS